MNVDNRHNFHSLDVFGEILLKNFSIKIRTAFNIIRAIPSSPKNIHGKKELWENRISSTRKKV